MNRKNKISTGNFKNAISIKPDDMLNVRSFTIPTNYTLFKSISSTGVFRCLNKQKIMIE